MSHLTSQPFEQDNDTASEFDAILHTIHSLRDELVTAWRGRAVLLTSDEQARLHTEVKRTCQL